MIPEASASWRLKLSNLKKILKSIDEYYSETLHLSLNKFPRPDPQLIGIYLNHTLLLNANIIKHVVVHFCVHYYWSS